MLYFKLEKILLFIFFHDTIYHKLNEDGYEEVILAQPQPQDKQTLISNSQYGMVHRDRDRDRNRDRNRQDR